MKKSLVALAAMAVAGMASAQSSVTLFGVVDVGYNRTSATGAGHVSRFASDRYNSTRLGFRGTEDLGGGMSAGFWLEAGFNPDNGVGTTSTSNNTSVAQTAQTGVGGNTSYAPGQAYSAGGTQGLTFNRRSTVSLMGNWGELRIGRDYVPTFWNTTVFDAFGTNGVGSYNNILLGTLLPGGRSAVSPPGNPSPQVRSSNSIGYFLPANLGGFYGQAMYALAETPSTCTGVAATTGANGNLCQAEADNGRYMGVRLGFASGPFNVAGSIGRTRYGNTQTSVVGFGGGLSGGANANVTTFAGDYDTWNIGGQWDFGMAKLLAQYNRQNYNGFTAAVGLAAPTGGAAISDAIIKSWVIGTLIPVGAGEIRVAYARGTADGVTLTPLVGAAATSAERKQSQWALGYVHNFSKRTAVFATYARLTARGAGASANMGGFTSTAAGASGSVSASGWDLGVRHSF